MFGNVVTRETVKANYEILMPAVQQLGLRVSVPCCQVHVAALYTFMEINCPGALALR